MHHIYYLGMLLPSTPPPRFTPPLARSRRRSWYPLETTVGMLHLRNIIIDCQNSPTKYLRIGLLRRVKVK